MNLLRLTMPDKNDAILSELYESMNYADVILTCSDSYTNQKPVAHKLVLSSCSHFLKELLEGNLDSHELIIPDLSTSTMLHILQLLYTGEVRVENQEEISQVVEGIQLLGINSAVNSIQFSPETCQRIVPIYDDLPPEVEIQQNWPTSEMMSPVSLKDYSSHWPDSNDVGSRFMEVETVVPPPPVSKKVKPKTKVAKKETSTNSHVQGPENKNVNVKKKRVKRTKVLTVPSPPISTADQKNLIVQDLANQANDVPEPEQLNSTLFKTETVDEANGLPISANQFKQLDVLEGHDHNGCGSGGHRFESCDTQDVKIHPGKKRRLKLLQDASHHDHSYASKKIPKM